MTAIKNDTLASRVFIVILGACFLCILAASLIQRFMRPGLTVHLMEGAATQAPQEAMDGENMEAIGRLMREVAANPQDKDKTISLVEALMQAGQWQVAENFAQKAMALPDSESSNSKLLYLLAIIHHNKGEHSQAAELLEKTLEKGENPSARYSLGILYLHFLNKPERGIAELEKGLEAENLQEGLRAAMQEELAKVKSATNAPAPENRQESMQ